MSEISQSGVLKKKIKMSDPKWIEKHILLNGNPLKLYPYQARFIQDRSPKRIVLKSRQTGFSTIISLEALLKCVNANRTVLIVSVAERQALEIMNNIKNYLNHASKLTFHGKKLFGVSRETKQLFEFANNSRIISLPNNPRAARGYPATDVYLDENAWLEKSEDMDAAIVPTLSHMPNGTITRVSTPAGRLGKFYDIWEHAKKLGYSKHKVHWKMCPDKSYQKKILEIKQSIDAFSFTQEYELAFLSGGMGFFSPKLVRPCIVNKLSEQLLDKKNYVQFGMDIGKISSNTALVVVEKAEKIDEDSKKKFNIYVRKVVLWPLGTNYDLIRNDYKRYYDYYRPVLSKVDSSGVGERLAEEMRKELGATIVPTKFSQPMKERMFSELRVLFENKIIRIPNNNILLNQLFGFERTVTEQGTVRFKGKKDDVVMALALSCFELTRPRPYFGLRGV